MPDLTNTPNITPDKPAVPETPVPQAEQIEPSVEQKPEVTPEQVAEEVSQTPQPAPLPAAPVDAQPVPQPADPGEVKNIESVLSQDMENAFLTMDAATQAQFKIKGEETSQKIAILMRQTGVKVKQVIILIFDWLKIIPRVNKFYIEQEAKIKAEAILKMYKKE
ncbi:hypothetical protein HON36_03110 [Candidatus Parcubacteria bacterium]|jgi:hypothetical protein|nr:hypothetical protein [Candidatus Parcubacteria bacterium]MBT7228143.1 hypothetical protein [Candidatus Parcubacteria bacterium]